MSLSKKGQSTLEYAVLVMVIIGALIATSVYMKRGVQGRWKSSIDDVGDQYDPRISNTVINESLVSNSVTEITIQEVQNGFSTMREDRSRSVETKTGSVVTAAE